MTRRFLIPGLALAVPASVWAQQRRMGGVRGKATPGRDEATGLLVDFHGTVRRLEKGKLELVVEGEQELTFFVNKKTTFRQGTQILKSGEKLVGSNVTIEARREFLKDLIAVNVIAKAPEPSGNASSPRP